MRLETSLYTSSQGIRTHGTALTVVGDNISNSSTTGFKSTRADFEDLLAQSQDNTQSGNFQSIGSGSIIGDTKTLFNDGTIEYTGRSLDAGINGSGFFILSDGTTNYYSRAGDFSITEDGSIVNGDGLYLMGYADESATELSPISITEDVTASKETTTLTLSGNISASEEVTSVIENPKSFSELSQSATFIAGDINVYDSLGVSHSLIVAFFKTDQGEYTAQAYIDGADIGKEDGVPQKIGNDMKLSFNGDGTIKEEAKETAQTTLNIPYSDGANTGSISLDLSNFTQSSTYSAITSEVQDGYAKTNIKGYEFGSNGEFYAVLNDETKHQISTVALADSIDKDFSFVRNGNTLYKYTGDTDKLKISKANENGMGNLESASLELSNVDIADEFVDMIMYQRGYQANSQILTTTSDLLETTIGLLR